jgi:hypothetical protein
MDKALIYTHGILLILAGILAVSALIVAQKPDAKALIDKLTPYQALIGVGLLAVGLYHLIRSLKGFSDLFKSLMGFSMFAMIATAILLGFLFGMPQIAKWIPGDSTAEQKAQQFAKKVAPFQVILGIVGIGATLIFFMYLWGVIKPQLT